MSRMSPTQEKSIDSPSEQSSNLVYSASIPAWKTIASIASITIAFAVRR